MQFIDADGVPSASRGLGRHHELGGHEKVGYVVVEPDPADDRPEPLRSDLVVRPTRAGRKAQEIWQPLADEIEQRWQGRFGEEQICRLREFARGTRRPVRHRASSVPPGGLDPYVRRLERLNARVSCRTIRWCCTVAGFLTGVDRRPAPGQGTPANRLHSLPGCSSLPSISRTSCTLSIAESATGPPCHGYRKSGLRSELPRPAPRRTPPASLLPHGGMGRPRSPRARSRWLRRPSGAPRIRRALGGRQQP